MRSRGSSGRIDCAGVGCSSLPGVLRAHVRGESVEETVAAENQARRVVALDDAQPAAPGAAVVPGIAQWRQDAAVGEGGLAQVHDEEEPSGPGRAGFGQGAGQGAGQGRRGLPAQFAVCADDAAFLEQRGRPPLAWSTTRDGTGRQCRPLAPQGRRASFRFGEGHVRGG
ncbi:hypothetical protein GCM10010510_65810 [Streptomyces anandii JCM 4720]|nr:hypothetical protein GCM10010510_65810 [Streptomyces anandii JCM 4720]